MIFVSIIRFILRGKLKIRVSFQNKVDAIKQGIGENQVLLRVLKLFQNFISNDLPESFNQFINVA